MYKGKGKKTHHRVLNPYKVDCRNGVRRAVPLKTSRQNRGGNFTSGLVSTYLNSANIGHKLLGEKTALGLGFRAREVYYDIHKVGRI